LEESSRTGFQVICFAALVQPLFLARNKNKEPIYPHKIVFKCNEIVSNYSFQMCGERNAHSFYVK